MAQKPNFNILGDAQSKKRESVPILEKEMILLD